MTHEESILSDAQQIHQLVDAWDDPHRSIAAIVCVLGFEFHHVPDRLFSQAMRSLTDDVCHWRSAWMHKCTAVDAEHAIDQARRW